MTIRAELHLQPTPPPDPARILWRLSAPTPAERARLRPTPLTREDRIPDELCQLTCAPGPSDPRRSRDYLGSPRWTPAFARYLTGVTIPWWRHPYVVGRLAARDPRALALVQLASEVAEATGAPLIAVVPRVAPRLGMKARPAWLLYLRTEALAKRLGVRTAQVA